MIRFLWRLFWISVRILHWCFWPCFLSTGSETIGTDAQSSIKLSALCWIYWYSKWLLTSSYFLLNSEFLCVQYEASILEEAISLKLRNISCAAVSFEPLLSYSFQASLFKWTVQLRMSSQGASLTSNAFRTLVTRIKGCPKYLAYSIYGSWTQSTGSACKLQICNICEILLAVYTMYWTRWGCSECIPIIHTSVIYKNAVMQLLV